MKFCVHKSDLMDAVNTVIRALPAKSPNPILEGIYFEAKEGLRLMCSNSTLQIETTIDATIDQAGEVVLPGRLFSEILRKMPDGTIDIDIKNEGGANIASIINMKSKSQLQCLEAEEFPEMPQFSQNFTVSLPQVRIRDMITQSIFAVAQDESRPILTGINFEIKQDCLKIVALDGYRLAIVYHNGNNAVEGSAVLPASSLHEIAKILDDDEAPIEIGFNKTNCSIDLGKTRINTALLSGEFMKYDQIIPLDYSTTMRIQTKQFFDAVERATLMAREGKNNLIKLNIQQDQVIITSNSQIGNVKEDVPITLIGNELEIAFNSKYLNDVLKVIEDEEVFLKFNSAISPCLIQPVQGNAYVYLILPVRIFVK